MAKNKSRFKEQTLLAVCHQRNRLIEMTESLVAACRAAESALAFKDGKLAYRNEIMKYASECQKIFDEGFAERPKFDLKRIPSLRKQKIYSCGKRWFAKMIIGLLFEYDINEEYSKTTNLRFQKALENLIHVGMNSNGYADDPYEWERLVENEEVAKEGFDFDVPHSFAWLAMELKRFAMGFSFLGEKDWMEKQVFIETRRALVAACAESVGIKAEYESLPEIFEFIESADMKKEMPVETSWQKIDENKMKNKDCQNDYRT